MIFRIIPIDSQGVKEKGEHQKSTIFFFFAEAHIFIAAITISYISESDKHNLLTS